MSENTKRVIELYVGILHGRWHTTEVYVDASLSYEEGVELAKSEVFDRMRQEDQEMVFMGVYDYEEDPMPETESTVNKCDFCNVAPGTHEVEVKGSPGTTALACSPCLQEIQLGHVLKDIYGWSWTRFEYAG